MSNGSGGISVRGPALCGSRASSWCIGRPGENASDHPSWFPFPLCASILGGGRGAPAGEGGRDRRAVGGWLPCCLVSPARATRMPEDGLLLAVPFAASFDCSRIYAAVPVQKAWLTTEVQMAGRQELLLQAPPPKDFPQAWRQDRSLLSVDACLARTETGRREWRSRSFEPRLRDAGRDDRGRQTRFLHPPDGISGSDRWPARQ